ncbi:hypothetical protein A343_1974 [Porphyromonas gingivalis JCVI SC001]|nr:hypothetical protein A343_1974 [Porphyromonas gingivalis JCVI SC001]
MYHLSAVFKIHRFVPMVSFFAASLSRSYVTFFSNDYADKNYLFCDYLFYCSIVVFSVGSEQSRFNR